MFKRWLSGLLGIAGTLQVSVISMLLGLQPVPASAPIVGLVRRHPFITLGIGVFLLLTAAVGLLIAYRPSPFGSVAAVARRQTGSATFPYMPLLVSTTAVATVSTASVIGLLGVVLARPAWCPDALCPPLVIEPSGTYDSNLVVAYSAEQGSTFLLSADPAQYTRKTLPPAHGPRVVVAQRTVATPDVTPLNPYRLKISLRNRKATNPTMLIENVSMVIDSVAPQPSPTNVLLEPGQDEDLQGDNNMYTIVYRGEQSKAAIAAQYKGKRPGHVRLGPQELDYLTLTFSGTTSGQIRFRMRVDYRLTNESQTRTVTLDEAFTTVFVDPHGWQPYQLAGDRLLPA